MWFNETYGGELITNGSIIVLFWKHFTTHNTSMHDHPFVALVSGFLHEPKCFVLSNRPCNAHK